MSPDTTFLIPLETLGGDFRAFPGQGLHPTDPHGMLTVRAVLFKHHFNQVLAVHLGGDGGEGRHSPSVAAIRPTWSEHPRVNMLKFMTSYVAPAKRYFDLSQRSLPMHFDADDLCGSLIARVTRGEEMRYTLLEAAECLQRCVETLHGAPPHISLRELTSLLDPVYQQHTGLKLSMALSRSGTPRLTVPESDLLAHLILHTLSQAGGQQRLKLEANVLTAMAQA